MKDVLLLVGAGQIGMAIARRIGFDKKIIIGDKNLDNAKKIADIMYNAGFDVNYLEVDLADRISIKNYIQEAQKYGQIGMLINAAGVSPSQASIETILKVDLYGTAVLLEEVGKVIKPYGTGVTISSQSGHRMEALGSEIDEQLATTDCEDLLSWLCHNKQLINSHFYRGVSELPYKLLFAVIYTHLEFRYEVSHTITSHHVHHFHQTRIPDGTLLDYMVQYRKPLFPQFFLYPKKFLPENNPHHKEFHLRPYIQNNANQ